MQILVDLDVKTAARLEKVAPARSRRRSDFVRAAIRKALWEIEELATGRAYAVQPDVEPPAFDPAAWAPRRAAPPAVRPGRSPPARPRRRSPK